MRSHGPQIAKVIPGTCRFTNNVWPSGLNVDLKNKAVEAGGRPILGEIQNPGSAINRNRLVHEATHLFERYRTDSFVGGCGDFETVAMTLFESSLILAFTVLEFLRA